MPRRQPAFVLLGVALIGLIAAVWIWSTSKPAFSQQQYDEGYLEAFRINMTGPGWMDYKSEFWSMQLGFDDALSDFRKIYQHPKSAPFSYSEIDRFRDVLSHIETTDVLEAAVKDRILKQLRLDLSEWETYAASEGTPDSE